MDRECPCFPWILLENSGFPSGNTLWLNNTSLENLNSVGLSSPPRVPAFPRCNGSWKFNGGEKIHSESRKSCRASPDVRLKARNGLFPSGAFGKCLKTGDSSLTGHAHLSSCHCRDLPNGTWDNADIDHFCQCSNNVESYLFVVVMMTASTRSFSTSTLCVHLFVTLYVSHISYRWEFSALCTIRSIPFILTFLSTFISNISRVSSISSTV